MFRLPAGLTPACVTLAMWKWELQRVSVQPLMKTNKWRRNTLTKPNRNTLINYATGCESLCPFKSHTAVVCPFMQLRGVWVGGRVGGGGGGGGGGVKSLLRLRPIPVYLSSTRFMAKSLVNQVTVSVLSWQTESPLSQDNTLSAETRTHVTWWPSEELALMCYKAWGNSFCLILI